MKNKNFKSCIIINSAAYFVVAYFFVVFSYNLFAIWISTTWFGFDANLYFHGFEMKGAAWNRDNTVIIFFFGNSITLLIGFIFDWLYRRQRKYKRSIKIFFMWVYIIAYSWFLGNIMVGAVFNFGVGTALLAFRVPFFMRAALSLLSVLTLFFIGHRAQKGIKVSANLYYKRLAKGAINGFLLNQVVYPALIGIVILVIYKIPNIDEYKYMDWLVLSSLVFYILGLFIKQKNRSSIIFKNRDVKGDSDENDYHQNNKSCKIQTLAIIAFLIIVLGMRIGLNTGVAF
jgi:hypothetical protein